MDDDRSLQSETTRLAGAARDRANVVLEDVKVASGQVVDRVRELIEEGNVRRISLRKGDRVLFEIPLTVGVGAGAAALLTSPIIAAVGAVAALVSDITIAVERDEEAAADPDVATPSASEQGRLERGRLERGRLERGRLGRRHLGRRRRGGRQEDGRQAERVTPDATRPGGRSHSEGGPRPFPDASPDEMRDALDALADRYERPGLFAETTPSRSRTPSTTGPTAK